VIAVFEMHVGCHNEVPDGRIEVMLSGDKDVVLRSMLSG
jgi:hypothetical protein